MLYECDLCYLVQDFYNLSKLLGGGGGPGPCMPAIFKDGLVCYFFVETTLSISCNTTIMYALKSIVAIHDTTTRACVQCWPIMNTSC
jgi:hypothetical protein